MSGTLKPEEVFIKIKQLQDVQSSQLQSLKSKYYYFRYYEWQLGGVLLGMIEQSLILGNKEILNKLDLLSKKVLTLRGNVRAQTIQQAFSNEMKEIANFNNNQDSLNRLNEKLKDENFVQGSEQFMKEILKQQSKFTQYQYLNMPSSIKDSGSYIQPPILQFISEQFESEIVLIQYDKSIREFSYQSFKPQKKQIMCFIYSFPQYLYVGLLNQRQLTQANHNIGDGFLSNKELKEKQKLIMSKDNRHLISSSSIKREAINSNQSNIEDYQICNQCKSPFNKLLLYNNENCSHSFCYLCLKQKKSDSQYCLEQRCTKPINQQGIISFINQYSKLLLQVKQQKEQVNAKQQQQIQPNKQFENSQVLNKLKCSCCLKEFASDEKFYQDFQCKHRFCYSCIFDKFQQNKQKGYLLKCDQCKSDLNSQLIFEYIEKSNKQDSPKNFNKQQQQQQQQQQNQNISQEKLIDQQQSQQIKDKQPQIQQNKQCIKCKKMNSPSIMLFLDQCQHGYCMQCLTELQRVYSYKSKIPIICFFPTCTSKLTVQQISNFVLGQQPGKQNDNMINSQIIKPNNNDIKFDGSKSTQLSSDSTTQNSLSSVYDIPKCTNCRNKKNKGELYTVKGCNHKICIDCLEELDLNKAKVRCILATCKSYIDVEELEEFHFSQQLAQSQKLQDPKQNNFEVICSKCKKKDEIHSNSKPDYFKCLSCQKVTCLIHEGQVPSCKCYCEKCGSQCKISQNTVMCVKCNYSYCQNCKQTENGNQICKCICEFCGTQLKRAKQLCKCLENICSLCLNNFENIYLNSSEDTLMRKNQDCMHSFCNICYYKKVCAEQANEQKSNGSSYKSLNVCLLC